MMTSFDTVRERYGSDLEQLLARFFDEAGDSTGKAIASMSRYHFETGGKRLRALIPSYIYEVLGHNGRDLLPFGAAVEMIHNATLVHDDLQDGDELRRGRPTVWKKYSSAQAINCGDAMFQYANQLILRSELESRTVLRLIERAASATAKVIEGQAQEFLMKEEESYPGTESYLRVIRGKTSGLFALPVVGALEAAGVSEDVCAHVEESAQALGVLFQVQDDYLDLYGEKGRDRRATDVAEGKISFFVAHVYERGDDREKARLREILRKDRVRTSDAEIEEALALFDRTGARAAALSYMEGVQSSLHDDKFLKSRMPGVHYALASLSEQFLKPIANA